MQKVNCKIHSAPEPGQPIKYLESEKISDGGVLEYSTVTSPGGRKDTSTHISIRANIVTMGMITDTAKFFLLCLLYI